MIKIKFSFLMTVILFVSVQSFAQSTSGNKERKTTLNFEDELVEGQNTKPELFSIFQKKNFNYKRLIKLRENFLPEMRKTSEEIEKPRRND